MTKRQAILQKLFALGNSYWLTRFVILRLLGFVYAVAFLVAANQLVPLIGEHGLTPATRFLSEVTNATRFTKRRHVSGAYSVLARDFRSSRCRSSPGSASRCRSLFSAGTRTQSCWRSFGRSTCRSFTSARFGTATAGKFSCSRPGFLSIFLCPLLDGRPFPKCRPPILVIWLFRWLGFRIMIGAGLIKLRGDPCWRDLTCLYYHYETQPIPNPISRYLHFAPHWFHKFETAWNHFVELIVPWFSFGPRTARHIAGVLLVTFQIFLIISGNLSFLNYLTIIPFLACFDDSFLGRFLPRVNRHARRTRSSEFAAVAHQQRYCCRVSVYG